jgi:hypothetical protein
MKSALLSLISIFILSASATQAHFSDFSDKDSQDSKISVENVLKNRNLFYPNPARDMLNIDNHDLLIEKIEVYNIIGSLVYAREIGDVKEPKIDVNNLERGNYIIRFYSVEKHIISKKVSLH